MNIKNFIVRLVTFSVFLIVHAHLSLAQDVFPDAPIHQDQPVQPEEIKLTVDNLNQLCSETYQHEATCPKDYCRLFCLEGESAEKCTLSCQPRPCVELTVDHCPVDTCQILDGCGDHSKRCFPKLVEEPPECGSLSYSGKLDCCQDFVKRCGVEYFDTTCDMKAEFSIYGVPQCIPCGNGICNQFENRCNCPEDCTN